MSTTQPDAVDYLPELKRLFEPRGYSSREFSDWIDTIGRFMDVHGDAIIAELESLRAEKAANAGLVEIGKAIKMLDDAKSKLDAAKQSGTGIRTANGVYAACESHLQETISDYRASREKGASHA